ncbi:MAG: elongation factor P [Candidatus Omnitrophica bacterium]|nr:elongation factor P [Candidatus Omnitrophota bacterium]
MISPNELKNGLVIKLNNGLFTVIQFQHIKPGKGGAFVRTKLKNLKLGTVIDKTFRESERIEEVFIEEKALQFLYKSDGHYYFMDNETFDQFSVDKDILGGGVKYLKDNLNIFAYLHEGNIIFISLPSSVNLKVEHTEQGIRGDTARGGTKPATVETGLKVLVPLFINTGDTISVDTRTGKYLGRI